MPFALDERWYAWFQRQLYAFSYQELVEALLMVTGGRKSPRSPLEVVVGADLAVFVSASPRLRLGLGFDEETVEAVTLLEHHLRDRDALIRRVAMTVARAQRAYLFGASDRARPLALDVLARHNGVSVQTLGAVLRNKRVQHPRGVSMLMELVRPFERPLDGPAAVPPRKPPRPPLLGAFALMGELDGLG